MLEGAGFDGASPGICIKLCCDGTAVVEPDQGLGRCEVCGGNIVVPALVLAAII
jgi:hypothetical protein